MSYKRIEFSLQSIQKPELLDDFKNEDLDDEAVASDVSNISKELEKIFPSLQVEAFLTTFNNSETIMSESREMKVVRIVELNSGPSPPYFIIKDQLIEEILAKSNGRKVGILSMIGSPETENTVYLNYVMRCLKKWEDEGMLEEGWLIGDTKNFQSPLEGFPWGKAAQNIEPGVWITNYPFIIKNGEEELALYVTHTTFLRESSPLNERISFLQLISSSLTIYSISDQNGRLILPLGMKWNENTELHLGHLFFLLKSPEDLVDETENFLENHPELRENLNMFSSIDGYTIIKFPENIQQSNAKGSLEEIDEENATFLDKLEDSIMKILDESRLGNGLSRLDKRFFNEPILTSNYVEFFKGIIEVLNLPLENHDTNPIVLNEKAFNSLTTSLIKFVEKDVRAFYATKLQEMRGRNRFINEVKFQLSHEEIERKALDMLSRKLNPLLSQNDLNRKFNLMKAHLRAKFRTNSGLNRGEKRNYLENEKRKIQLEFENISGKFSNLNDREFLLKCDSIRMNDLIHNKKESLIKEFSKELTENEEATLIKFITKCENGHEIVSIKNRYLTITKEMQVLKAEEQRRADEETLILQQRQFEAEVTLNQCYVQSIENFKSNIKQIELSSIFSIEFEMRKQAILDGFKPIEYLAEEVFNKKKMELEHILGSLYYASEKKHEKRKINNVDFIFLKYKEIMKQLMNEQGKPFYVENELEEFDKNARERANEYFKDKTEEEKLDFSLRVNSKYQEYLKENSHLMKENSVYKEQMRKEEVADQVKKEEMKQVCEALKRIPIVLNKGIVNKINQHKVKNVRELKESLKKEIEEVKLKLEKIKLAYKDKGVQDEIKSIYQKLESFLNGEDANRLDGIILHEMNLTQLEKSIREVAGEKIELEFGKMIKKGEMVDNLNKSFEIKSLDIEKILIDDFKTKNKITSEIEINRLRKKVKDAFDCALASYTEENLMNATKYPVVGIDFGTSFTSCVVFSNGESKAIKIDDGEELSPSIVAFQMPIPDESQEIDLNSEESPVAEDPIPIVGSKAKKQDYKNPINTIYEVKRLLARMLNDPQLKEDMRYWQSEIISGDKGRAMIKLTNGQIVDPKDVVTLILQNARKEAKKYCSAKVTYVVITIPVKASKEYSDVLYEAAFNAGFEQIHFMREPVAAAISYRMNMPEFREDASRKIMIFDFGGGTLDLCVFECNKNSLRVIENGGDQHFGGKNFDKAIFEHIIDKLKADGKDYLKHKNSDDPVLSTSAKIFERQLLTKVEMGKQALSNQGKTIIALDDEGTNANIQFELTREALEIANESNFNKITLKLQKLFLSKKVEKSEITHVILVGGMANIPKVQQTLRDFFGENWGGKIVNEDDKQLAVAKGAARHAAKLFGQEKSGGNSNILDKYKLQDIVPGAIGIGAATDKGAIFQLVIPRGSVIPFEKKIECTNDRNNKKVFVPIYEEIEVDEGNTIKDEIGDKNEISLKDERLKRIGSFNLETTGEECGTNVIDIVFYYDSNLMIRIEALNHTTGNKMELEIQSKFPMSQATKENSQRRIHLIGFDEDDEENCGDSGEKVDGGCKNAAGVGENSGEVGKKGIGEKANGKGKNGNSGEESAVILEENEEGRQLCGDNDDDDDDDDDDEKDKEGEREKVEDFLDNFFNI